LSEKAAGQLEQKEKRGRLTEGAVAGAILGMTGPMIFGIFSIMLMNLTDAFFVAQLGKAKLAALSFTFPVVTLVGNITMGLAVGVTSVVSRYLGSGEWEMVRKLTTHALLLALLVVASFITVGLLTIDPLFRALGASESALVWIRDYMTIWYIGIFFLVIPMVGNGALRAAGDTKTPAMMMFVAAIVNIILDPILIFGWWVFPRMELKGAALATVISRILTLLVALWVLGYRERMLALSRGWLEGVLASWRAVLSVALPAAGTQIAAPLSLAALTGFVAVYGEDAVAAFGAAGRIEMFFLMIPMAMGAAMGPFVGQNWGAKRPERVAAALRFAYLTALCGGILAYGVTLLLASSIAGAFSKDAGVASKIITYLWIVPLGYPFAGAFFSSTAAFNAIGQPIKAASLALLRMPILAIPFAMIGSAWWGLMGIFVGMAGAQILTGIAALLWSRSLYVRRKEGLGGRG
jgi:putative MATE family efflux protein